MSFKFYNKFWIVTCHDLKNALVQESLIEKLKNTSDRNVAHRILASLYPRYVVLCNNLGEIYDQTLQVQKRVIVGKLLQAVTERLQELQKKLSEVELSEIIYVDRTLIENHLVPQDITVLRPFYFPLQRSVEIQNLIDGIKPEADEEEVVLTGLDRFKVKLTPAEQERERVHQILVNALNLIKMHEKARHARTLLNNIINDPATYKPKPEVITDSIAYEFYHKKDTVMLVPVKRTVFESNFYLEEENFTDFSFYEKPKEVIDDGPQFGRKKKKPKVSVILETIIKEATPPPSLEVVAVAEEEDVQAKVRDQSALRIQIAWKYFKLRQRVRETQLKRLKVLSMIEDRKWDFSQEAKIEESLMRRRQKKALFDEAFLKAVEDEKAKILKVKGPWLMEDISDHIREWFRQFYYTIKDFDRYPEEFEGGTILVVRGDTMTPEEFEANKAEKEANKAKSPEQKKKEKEAKEAEKEKIKEKLKAEKERKKQDMMRRKRREKEGKFRMEFKPKYPEDRSKALTAFEQHYSDYEKEWYFIDEAQNPKEYPIMEWITIDQYAEVHKELRPIVDEVMRIEFELLRAALAKDSKKKYKPQKKKKQRKKKGKKGKKKKKTVDLLEENTVEQLYDQLVDLGVLTKYKTCSLDNFLSDMNYKAYEQRQLVFDPIHGNEELKTVIRTSILGLGPLTLPKPKSILFAGPPLSGKKYLAHAICSETNSVLFDLSPEKITPIENMKYFITLITQMSRILQPTVLFINGAHKPFYKKIPKPEAAAEPRKLGKYLVKLLKQYKKNERIMLIGTTNEPWNSKIGKMKKCFEKILLVPRSDYGSTFITWHHDLLNLLKVPRDICVSPLAMVTQGLSSGQIMNCIATNVDITRRMKFSRHPLTLEELLEAFVSKSIYPQTLQDFNKYLKWYKKANKKARMRAKLVLDAHPPETDDDKKKKK